MTLREWTELSGRIVRPMGDGAYAIANEKNEHYSSLWKLTDFAVSSVFAGQVWLCPIFTASVS